MYWRKNPLGKGVRNYLGCTQKSHANARLGGFESKDLEGHLEVLDQKRLGCQCYRFKIWFRLALALAA